MAERIHAAAAQPDVRFECLAGAGHVCNLEAPAAFDAALVEFLQQTAS